MSWVSVASNCLDPLRSRNTLSWMAQPATQGGFPHQLLMSLRAARSVQTRRASLRSCAWNEFDLSVYWLGHVHTLLHRTKTSAPITLCLCFRRARARHSNRFSCLVFPCSPLRSCSPPRTATACRNCDQSVRCALALYGGSERRAARIGCPMQQTDTCPHSALSGEIQRISHCR
jgi:hypothetical protein